MVLDKVLKTRQTAFGITSPRTPPPPPSTQTYTVVNLRQTVQLKSILNPKVERSLNLAVRQMTETTTY
jgi:hypothetical protein